MPESQLSESSKQLLYPETAPASEPVQKQKPNRLGPLLGLLVLMLVFAGLGLWVRSLQNPNPDPEQLPPPPETTAPTPADIPSPGADIPSPGAESPSPGAESPSPSPESSPAEIPAPSPESTTPPEIPVPSPSPEIPPP